MKIKVTSKEGYKLGTYDANQACHDIDSDCWTLYKKGTRVLHVSNKIVGRIEYIEESTPIEIKITGFIPDDEAICKEVSKKIAETVERLRIERTEEERRKGKRRVI